jgi:hypothetical protein
MTPDDQARPAHRPWDVKRVARDVDVHHIDTLNHTETALNLADALQELQAIAVEYAVVV